MSAGLGELSTLFKSLINLSFSGAESSIILMILRRVVTIPSSVGVLATERLMRLLKRVESSPNPADKGYVDEYIEILGEMAGRAFRETGSFEDFMDVHLL